jgi:hypothetical protein
VSDHVHTWTPIPGECARYECACTATGWRCSTGEIREHRKRLVRSRQWTARARLSDGDGRIPAMIREDWNGGKERDS